MEAGKSFGICFWRNEYFHCFNHSRIDIVIFRFRNRRGAQVDHDKFIEMAGTVGIGNPSLQERLWDLFDTNGDGEVETEELVLNLSQLLRGDVQDVSRFCYQDF